MSVREAQLDRAKETSRSGGKTAEEVEVRYSRQIGNRLSLAMRARRWSQTRLADKLGVTNNTLGRIIAGQERLNMNLCCRAMELMEYDPSLLLTEKPIAGSWTGLAAIDAMLTDVYSDTSQSGVDGLGQYVTADYLCCSHHYIVDAKCDLEEGGAWDRDAEQGDRKQRQRVYDKAHQGRSLLGIPFELERKQNLLGSMGTRFERSVASAVLVDEDCVFVQVDIQRRTINDDALQSQFVCGEMLYLKNSFMSISKGASVRVRRKVWFKLNDARDKTAHSVESSDVGKDPQSGYRETRDYSKMIGSRLAQAMEKRRWSQTNLAGALGVTNNTLGRIIAGQDRLNMNLCCRAMELLNYDPSLLLSDKPLVAHWTGVPAVDAMLADVYGEITESGVEGLGKYATKDYLCCTHHYTEFSNVELDDGGAWDVRAPETDRSLRQRVYDKARHGRDLIGIPYALEYKDNAELWSKGAYFIRDVLSATLIGEDCVFVESIAQWKEVDSGTVQHRPDQLFFDLLYLKNTFMSISQGASVRIRRKVWWYGVDLSA